MEEVDKRCPMIRMGVIRMIGLGCQTICMLGKALQIGWTWVGPNQGAHWHHLANMLDLLLRKVSFGCVKRTNKISSKQPKSYLLLTLTWNLIHAFCCLFFVLTIFGVHQDILESNPWFHSTGYIVFFHDPGYCLWHFLYIGNHHRRNRMCV